MYLILDNVILSCPLELIVHYQPSNLAFHNLCDSTRLPNTLRSLLGLGTGFCVRPSESSFSPLQFDRFNMDYDCQLMFSGSPDLEQVDLYMKNEDFEPDMPTDTLLQQ